PVAERLASFVADKGLLLVLDNCEHLVEACAGLARRLLQAGPAVRVLATSREGLGVPGEGAWPGPPLAAPAAPPRPGRHRPGRGRGPPGGEPSRSGCGASPAVHSRWRGARDAGRVRR